jgi:KaiC/GvpD/RAD55 family RecA-like ATPase
MPEKARLYMERIQFSTPFFQLLLPEGLSVPSSTVITGAGGSGKPLIGNFIVSEWLQQGGSVIFMSLQYPEHEFIKSSLRSITNLDLDEYQDKIVFIGLDVNIDGIQFEGTHLIKANVVNPENWIKAIDTALGIVPKEGPGVLLFSSALNLLLFSPTYGSRILEQMKRSLKEGDKYSVLYTTSTSAKGDQIAELDPIADNLITVRSDQGTRKLYLTIHRMKDVPFLSEEVEVPIAPKSLAELKQVADQSRKRIVPLVMKL